MKKFGEDGEGWKRGKENLWYNTIEAEPVTGFPYLLVDLVTPFRW